MELQILKGHSTFKLASEYEPDVFKKNLSSLALLPYRNFAVFETQYLLEYYIQRTKNFTMY